MQYANWPLFVRKKYWLSQLQLRSDEAATHTASAETAIKWLYDILTMLDAKASALMRLNGVLIAAAAFLLGVVGRQDTILATDAADSRLIVFCALLSAMQFLMCLIFPNFNAMAMEPLGAVAGTASAVLGVFTTVGGTIIGMVVGRTFDGTVLPLGLTYFICAVVALLVILWAEKGRLVVAPLRTSHATTG